MNDKIKRMKTLVQDSDYLRGEYESIKLWGDCPDGDVKFERLMVWLEENEHIVTHMIKVSKEIKEI